MTKGFRDKLGQGGYGSVYKGKFRSGHDVAVKLLGRSGGKGQDFMNEIATIGRIHHVNIVKLVGYCAHGSKLALVIDFMTNGSLEKYLFNRDNMKPLNWKTKFEIAVGVARGIEICKNIVSLTAARGTIGYVAPDLINRSNDIEIEEANEMEFADENESRKSIIKKMTIVALWCILMTPDDRPSMNKVQEMLEGDVEHLHIPSQSTQIGVSFDQIEIACSSYSVSLLHHADASIVTEV
ncbi:rust resistance kinase Lr10-like [Salvia hispanica]|uniref:rust resistance kinase Lr10-like n=1 Tax=Salvia hispanica TaxID=49212 RepID=UPI0020093882|nr:rust resistance kinase Lr10-like [Salvia hispanica]